MAGARGGSIRPLAAKTPQEEITELRRRLAATRWPDRETVSDRSQGVRLAMLQDGSQLRREKLWLLPSSEMAALVAFKSLRPTR
jgi:hypothetical protein